MVALSGDKLNSVAVDAAGLITAVDGASAPAGLVVGEPLEVVLPGEGAGSGAAADAGDGSTSASLPLYGSLDDSGRATFDAGRRTAVGPPGRAPVRAGRG